MISISFTLDRADGRVSSNFDMLNSMFDRVSVATISSSNARDEEFIVMFSSFIVYIVAELFTS